MFHLEGPALVFWIPVAAPSTVSTVMKRCSQLKQQQLYSQIQRWWNKKTALVDSCHLITILQLCTILGPMSYFVSRSQHAFIFMVMSAHSKCTLFFFPLRLNYKVVKEVVVLWNVGYMLVSVQNKVFTVLSSWSRFLCSCISCFIAKLCSHLPFHFLPLCVFPSFQCFPIPFPHLSFSLLTPPVPHPLISVCI